MHTDLYHIPLKNTQLQHLTVANKPNKLFNLGKIPMQSVVSKVKTNREYLLSNRVANELNTYRTWEVFPVANDAYVPNYDSNGNEIEPKTYPGAPGVRSIFNKSGAVMLGGSTGLGYDVTKTTSEWRVSNNVPLMDSPEARKRIRKNSGCSIKELVDASEQGILGRETYSYSDFMYCKYLGKVSNNYLITLRRFPLPVDDYISSVGESSRNDKNIQSQNTVSIGCMVTWMGTPGNDMSNILKYSYKMPFDWRNSDWQSARGNDYDSDNGPLNAIAAAMDPTYRKHYQKGEVGSIFNSYIGKHFKAGDATYNLAEMQEWEDKNKVYGPVDAIKGSYMRGSGGLEFDQKISLQFDYELRAYNGINPRQAMLDLLSNILNVTYTTGTFWGGGYRGYGAGQSNIFTNLKIFKANGGFSSFIDAACDDVTTLTGAFRNSIGGGTLEGVMKALINTANQLGGMILGGFLNKLGRPAKAFANSLLSPAPVGFWHLTIGNPHHPIMSLGNMIITNTTVEHYGPLGLDDFPTGLRVTVELERGKPRDIRDIEKIYMHGNDRIYSSMGQEIHRMYEKAKEYKGKSNTKKTVTGTDIKESTNNNTINKDDLQGINMVWQKYFGTTDVESIKIAAMEQENGSQKKKSKTASGDSRQSGTGTGR